MRLVGVGYSSEGVVKRLEVELASCVELSGEVGKKLVGSVGKRFEEVGRESG